MVTRLHLPLRKNSDFFWESEIETCFPQMYLVVILNGWRDQRNHQFPLFPCQGKIAQLATAEEKKLNRERAKLAMRAAIAESQGAPMDIQEEEEEALEDIGGSLHGPLICKKSASFASFNPSTLPRSSSTSASGKRNYFVSGNRVGSQASLEGTGWNKKMHEQIDITTADFWFFNNLSMYVPDSPYWLNLVNAISILGKGYKPPSRKNLSGRSFDNAVDRARVLVEDQKKEWKKYGCTILSDGWTDGRSRTIINFLVACKDDVVF